MPTTLPRHIITETPDIAACLDDAAKWWPDAANRRAELVRRLIRSGHQARAADAEARRERELKALKELSGSLTGIWPPDAIEQLRADWPE